MEDNVSSESTNVDSTEQSSVVDQETDSGVSSTNQAEFSEELENAIDEGATQAEIKQMIKEYELKVNGKTVKASLDLSNDEEVKKYLQKAHAFNDASQEASKYKKEFERVSGVHQDVTSKFENVLQDWKKAPSKFFESLGVDKYEFINQQIEEFLAEQEMDPKDKELRSAKQRSEELERELQSIRQREDKLREETSKQAQLVEQERLISEIESSIFSGLKSNNVTKAITEYGIISEGALFDEAVDLMTRMQSSVGEDNKIIEIEDVLPFLEKKYKAIFDLASKSQPRKEVVPVQKRVLPPTPSDTRATATSAELLAKAQAESDKNKPKRSFNEVMKRR